MNYYGFPEGCLRILTFILNVKYTEACFSLRCYVKQGLKKSNEIVCYAAMFFPLCEAQFHWLIHDHMTFNKHAIALGTRLIDEKTFVLTSDALQKIMVYGHFAIFFIRS